MQKYEIAKNDACIYIIISQCDSYLFSFSLDITSITFAIQCNSIHLNCILMLVNQ